jgi:hypothetical protein
MITVRAIGTKVRRLSVFGLIRLAELKKGNRYLIETLSWCEEMAAIKFAVENATMRRKY